MANYAVVDWTSDPGTLAEVAAAMEVLLETIDSTTNTIVHIDIVPAGGGGSRYQGVIIYSG